MANDDLIFGDNEKLRNAFFSMLGDTDEYERRRAKLIRLKWEFLRYENMPKQIAQYKEANKEMGSFITDIEKYWWGEKGDRIKYRKMNRTEREAFKRRINEYLSRGHSAIFPPRFTYAYAISYENKL
ncbi:MAG: hypothetical protein OXB93_01175, partial [Cytophagales bacterium]|nr:hypothetical protein [Cytophagales bacterium]